MEVKLLSHTINPEETVAMAAKLCYSKGIPKMGDGRESIEAYIERLRSIGHESPFEHASFTFLITGVSRSLLAQITRHRIASFSVQSQRYVDLRESFSCTIPPSIKDNPEAMEIFKTGVQNCVDTYKDLYDVLTRKNGDDKATQKKALEDARFILPNSCNTNIIMTMNARSLFNFFKERCCNRAQWEIRELAEKMLRKCVEVAPSLFKKCGPPCVNGACAEGSMSCGNPRKENFYRIMEE